jgi:surface polysaccharide O-acyltransferase-like enzyme
MKADEELGAALAGSVGQAQAEADHASSRPATVRLLFIDNLRWVMIALVVTVHAAVTYSNIGSWYYTEPAMLSPLALLPFVFYETHLQAFFMGLLFFVDGYFVQGSFDRKGAERLLWDRAVRLGVPTAIYALVVNPGIVYYLMNFQRGEPWPSLAQVYPRYLAHFWFVSGTGPMWFALALLIFTGIYTLARVGVGPRKSDLRSEALPNHAAVLGVIGVISACTFLIRLVQPIGTNVLNMQLCFFPQYIGLFAAGLVAYRRDCLLRIPETLGLFWLKLALVAGPLFWVGMMAAGGAINGDFEPYKGGWHWQSAAYSLWESFFCVSACLGLLVVFRKHCNSQGRLARFLSDNAFAVYVFHAPIVIALSLAMRGLALHPLLKFVLLSMAGLTASYLVSSLVVRRIPGLRRVL